uniref:Protein Dos n=1 Tax=Naja naja TaxID=35670 RepID=A0A8C6V4U6_NAJNA
SPSPPQDGYVLLLVLLSIFIGGTLVLLFGILIVCRRCCETDRRRSRASDDPEKTNTTYLDDSHSSYRDAESERFLSSGSATGRRVSFNEAALFEQSKKTQEKGRRYTLTEGDFHHLKNARLSHLPLPPSAALKIVTIHECEANENSVMMTPRLPPVKPSLAIFQPWGSVFEFNTPRDTFNSSIEAASSVSSDSGEGVAAVKGAPMAPPQELPSAPAQGTVLHFLTRLRRHASLEGASPYFRIKKWKLETSQRASSLDTRGSPKRHQFQRQRAASESMDQDRDPHQTDIIQYIARTDDVVFRPVAGPFLPAPASPTLSLGRYFSVDKWEGGEGRMGAQRIRADRDASQLWTAHPFYHDIWSLRASLEKCVSSEKGNNQDSAPSDGGDSVSSSSGLPSFSSSLAMRLKPERTSPWQNPSRIEETAGAVGGLLPSSPLLWAPYGRTLQRFVRPRPPIDESPAGQTRSDPFEEAMAAYQAVQRPGHPLPHSSGEADPCVRGDSVNYPWKGYHSTLPALSALGEEVASPAASGEKIQVIEEEPPEEAKTGPDPYSRDCLESGQCPGLGTDLLDKITGGLEDMFFTPLKKPRESLECMVMVAARASPEHSPE